MKKNLLWSLCVILSMGMAFTSCSDDDDNGKFISAPLLGVQVLGATSSVNQEDRIVSVNFVDRMDDLTEIEVTFTLAEGAVMEDPSTNPAVLNLSSDRMIRIKTGGKSVYYRIVTYMPDPDPDPLPDLNGKYINSFAVTSNGIAGYVELDNENTSVNIIFPDGADLSAVDVTLGLPAEVETDPEQGEWDLTDLNSFNVTYDGETIEYSVTAAIVAGFFIPDATIPTAWSRVITDIPPHIALYRIGVLDGKSVNAYVIMAKHGATECSVVTDGYSNMKTLGGYSQDDPNAPILISGSGYLDANGDPQRTYLLVKDGVMFEDVTAATNTTVIVDQSGNWHFADVFSENGDIYRFGTRDKFDPKYAFGGLGGYIAGGSVNAAIDGDETSQCIVAVNAASDVMMFFVLRKEGAYEGVKFSVGAQTLVDLGAQSGTPFIYSPENPGVAGLRINGVNMFSEESDPMGFAVKLR